MNNENNNTTIDWIHKARIEIYEKTKNMSLEEVQEYFRKSGEEAALKYGFTIEKALDSKVHADIEQALLRISNHPR
jgi:hypothetical protein